MPLTKPTLNVGTAGVAAGESQGLPAVRTLATVPGGASRVELISGPYLAESPGEGRRSHSRQLTLRHPLDALPAARELTNGPALPSFCSPAVSGSVRHMTLPWSDPPGQSGVAASACRRPRSFPVTGRGGQRSGEVHRNAHLRADCAQHVRSVVSGFRFAGSTRQHIRK
jgi:hypothetical protein